MSGHLLAVRWRGGIADEDSKPIMWIQASFLPKLLGATSVTIRRKVRSRKLLADCSAKHVRHELRHVWQQAQWLPWWPWLGVLLFVLWFVVNPWFRKKVEQDAKAQELLIYPVWRVIGTVN